MVCAPVLGIGLGDHAGQFHRDLGDGGDAFHALGPAFQTSRDDRRLGDVIDHHAQFRDAIGKFGNHEEMLRTQQQIIRKIAPRQLAQALNHAAAQQPAIVRFVVNGMPHALKLCVALQLVQPAREIGGSQLHPRHHALDEIVLLGQRE